MQKRPLWVFSLVLPLLACQTVSGPTTARPDSPASDVNLLAKTSPKPAVSVSADPKLSAQSLPSQPQQPDKAKLQAVDPVRPADTPVASSTPATPADAGPPTQPAQPDPPAEPEGLSIVNFAGNPAPAQSRHEGHPDLKVGNGRGDAFWFWEGLDKNQMLMPIQARYMMAGQIFLLLFYTDNGELDRIENEKTGEFVTFETLGDSFVVKVFDAGARYAGGYSVNKQTGRFFAAPILGRPYFSGQLTLELKGAKKPISAVLLPESQNASGQVQELPAALQSFVTRYPLPGSDRFTLMNEYRLASGLTSQSQSNALAQAAIFAPRLLSGLLSAQAAAIATPLLDAGLVAASSWQLAHSQHPLRPDLMSDTFARMSENQNPSEIVAAQAKLIAESGPLQALSEPPLPINSQSKASIPMTELKRRRQPAALPIVPVSLRGFAVDQDGQTVMLSGSVSTEGQLSADGSSDTGTLSIESRASNKLGGGSFSGYAGKGQYQGRVEPLGSCASQQKSGGQGTFVKAHYMNNSTDQGISGSGMTEFSFNAFELPDKFTVYTLDGKQYTTDGPVAYSHNVKIPVPKNWIVLVSVNAPASKTAWEYRLSCPQQ